MIRNRWISRSLIALAILSAASLSLAWNENGHRLSVELILRVRPDLAPKMSELLKHLPESRQWQKLRQGGLKPDKTDDLSEYVREMPTDLPSAAYFPDRLRDFRDYGSLASDHFVNLPFEELAPGATLLGGNAITAWNQCLTQMRSQNLGDRAWALTWLLHIGGDLYNPMHCVARLHPTEGRDRGGNLYTLSGKALGANERSEEKNVHYFWDSAFDGGSRDLPGYAEKLFQTHIVHADAASLAEKRKQLSPLAWAIEGRELIQRLGYPHDGRVGAYKPAMVSAAEEHLSLGAARIADILNGLL